MLFRDRCRMVPKDFKKLIDVENRLLLAERLRSGLQYLHFMHQTFTHFATTHPEQFTCPTLDVDTALHNTPGIQVIKLVSTILFDTLLQHQPLDCNLIQQWLTLLHNLLERHIPAARWFIAQLVSHPFNTQWFEHALLKCPEVRVREAVANLIKNLLKLITPLEYSLFPTHYPTEETNKQEGYLQYPGESKVFEVAIKKFDAEQKQRLTRPPPKQYQEVTFAQLKDVAVSLQFVNYLLENVSVCDPFLSTSRNTAIISQH